MIFLKGSLCWKIQSVFSRESNQSLDASGFGISVRFDPASHWPRSTLDPFHNFCPARIKPVCKYILQSGQQVVGPIKSRISCFHPSSYSTIMYVCSLKSINLLRPTMAGQQQKSAKLCSGNCRFTSMAPSPTYTHIRTYVYACVCVCVCVVSPFLPSLLWCTVV